LSIINNLYNLGFSKTLAKEFEIFEKDYSVGRVCAEYKNMYKILTEDKEILGTISGKLNYQALGRIDYPAVGDWVVIDKISNGSDRTIIHKILSRKSKFSRKVAGNVIEEQIMAVNIDILFICMSLNNDFNLRRIERYTTMAWESGAVPVVLLTKADLCSDVYEKVGAVESVAIGIDIKVVSSLEDTGIDLVKSYLYEGKTAAFLGSSGVGKSTLINKLLGNDVLATKEVREGDDRGRHTTTHRELFLLPDGGIVIDTPGMREFQILDAVEGIDSSFEDILELAAQCRFSDCTHNSEPGCVVRKSLEDGALSEARFENYLKLKKEAEYIARKTDKAAASAYIKQIKTRSKSIKQHFKKY
jgi:ribosome biogenesis GTPase / thiamine phosphate phosphatase